MHSKIVVVAFLLAFFLSAMMGAQFIVPIAGTPGTIQDAINAASPGDTILVASGTYHEHLVINKSLTLRGAGSDTTFINGDGEKNKTIVRIVASNVEVTGFTIENGSDKEGYSGIGIWGGVNVTIRSNVIRKSYNGVFLSISNSCNIINNTITENYYGIRLSDSRSNRFIGNNITNNQIGIWLTSGASRDNVFYHNNFISNIEHQALNFGSGTVWDDGYPSGGNYWSDYGGFDKKSGPKQDETGSDGIGDRSYLYLGDKYPLMGPFNMFDAGTWNGVSYNVDIISNSTISDFHFNPEEGAFLRFNVNGTSGTVGFCRVTIPKSLLWVEDGWTITVGGQSITDYGIIPDGDFTYLYFSYNHSTKTVIIQGTYVVPEFPTAILLPMFMIATLIAIVFVKRRCSTAIRARHISVVGI